MQDAENGDRRLVGWGPITDHLNQSGRRVSKSTMQKIGRRSVGGFNDALLGYHGVHPVTTERRAEDWWDANLRPVVRAPEGGSAL
jgi:hypothetical protein